MAVSTGMKNTFQRSCGCWFKRTLLEQILIVVACCMVIVILAISIVVHQRRNFKEAEDVCSSAQCILATTDLMTSINMSLNPCVDFYEYACQTWINETMLFDQQMDKFSELAKKLSLKMKEILNEDYDFEIIPEHFQRALVFFQSCSNLTQRQMDSLKPLLDDIQSFGGFPVLLGDKWNDTDFDYLTTLGKMLNRGYDNGILFTVGIMQDFKNTSLQRFVLSQAQPGMEELSWFARDDILDSYSNYTSHNAKLLCAEMINCSTSSSDIDKEIRRAVMLERDITEIMYPEAFTANKQNTYHIFKISDLAQLAGKVQWERLVKLYLPNDSISDETEVMVLLPDFMINIATILSNYTKTKTGRRSLANYMVYRQVKEAGLHLTREMRRAYYDFVGEVTGNTHIPDLWEDCVSFTMKVSDFSLASQYVKRFLAPGRRKVIQNLVEILKAELATIITQTKWMDDVTRQEAMRKLQSIYLMAIYPDGLLDDQVLNNWYAKMSVGISHYENYISTNVFGFQKEFSDYGHPVDRTNWKYLPSSILDTNAYYYGLNNSIFVPLGVTQDWFIHDRGPLYVNYGRMGFVLGHELSHAFDVTGAEEDENGNWRNWWQSQTFEQFLNNSKCMINMFDGYYSKEANMSVNGSLTITENIADDVGITQAYAAFKKANKKTPSQRLPGISLTVEQLFWTNYASVWCTKSQAEYLRILITTDFHSPARFRVNSPLSNSNAFLNDFNCRPGDGMYKTLPQCHVWGADSG